MSQPSDFTYVGHNAPSSVLNPNRGGTVFRYTAGGTLNIGDVVQISGTQTVNKATTNPNRTIGVVVGGDSLVDKGLIEFGTTTGIAALIQSGIVAATVGQTVIVQVQGMVYVRCDGVIANAAQIKASTNVAGRVMAAVSAATIAAGATAVTSSAANGAIISGDDFAGHVIGKNTDAVSADGDIRLVYINIH